MNKYILWDLDGTVVESENIGFKNNMFNHASRLLDLKFNLKPDEFIGHEALNIFKTVLDRNGIKNKEAYLDKYTLWYEEAVNFIKINVSQIPPRENIIELWSKANDSGINNAIVTSSREDIARKYLQNIGLEKLCVHYTCINHVTEPKPSPIPYLRAMEKLKTTTSNCIVVEDSRSGIKSAKAANLYTIAWVKDKFKTDYALADIILSKLSFNLIEQAFKRL